MRRSRPSEALAALLCAGSALSPSPIRAQPRAQAPAAARPLPAPAPASPAVQGHLDRALEHFAARAYGPAALEFRRAYEKRASGDYLYAWAQSERLSGNCEAAIPLYEKFLAAEPTGANAEVARINHARCQTQVAAAAAARAPAITAPPPPPPPPHWYHDVPGAMLTGASVAAFGAAIAFRISADRSASARSEAQSYDVFVARDNAVTRWDSLTTGAVVVGSTLLVGGALRYAWKALRRP